MNTLKIVLLSGIALILAACNTSPAAPRFASVPAAWSDGVIIGRAYRMDSPAIGITGESLIIVVADGQTLTVQYRNADTNRTPQSIITGHSPYQPRLLPAGDGWHLLWYDMDSFGGWRLMNARLDAAGNLLRGPITVTSEAISNAAVTSGDGSSVVVVWADATARPTIYGQVIDSSGRPAATPPVTIAHHAGWPTLARTNSGQWVMTWLAFPDRAGDVASSRKVMMQSGTNALPWQHPDSLTQLGTLDLSDTSAYLETTALGLDQTHGYQFVSQRSAAGQNPTTTGFFFPLDTSMHTEAVRMDDIKLPASLATTPSDMPTGFNTGPAIAFTADDNMLSAGLPAPVQGQFAVLPVAFEVNRHITVAYFHAGHLVSYQPIIPASTVMGRMAMMADRSRNLTVVWANYPGTPDQPAELVISTTNQAVANHLPR